MITTSVYIEDWLDEGCPSTLEGWAHFLSGQSLLSADDGNRPLAQDGDTFAATEVQWHYVPAPRKQDGTYDLPECPDGFQYHAVAWGPGLAWSEDCMVSCRGDELVKRLIAEDRDATPEEDREDSKQQIASILAEYGDEPVEWVVLEGPQRKTRLVFHLKPPRCSFVEVA